MADIFIGLVHSPVYNQRREIITAALTTIDLHDLARLTAAYGLAGFYAITPLVKQRRLAQEMIAHWRQGWGATYNHSRAEAMALVHLAEDIDRARAEIAAGRSTPLTVGTSAVFGPGRTTFTELRRHFEAPRPVFILFGTGWGLTEEVLNDCDLVLQPIKGPTSYNHLSVRSAAGIILDRLLGVGAD